MKKTAILSISIIIIFALCFFIFTKKNNSEITYTTISGEEKVFGAGFAHIITSLSPSELDKNEIEFSPDDIRIATKEDLENYLNNDILIDNEKNNTVKELYFYKIYLNKEQLNFLRKHPEVYSIRITDGSDLGTTT